MRHRTSNKMPPDSSTNLSESSHVLSDVEETMNFGGDQRNVSVNVNPLIQLERRKTLFQTTERTHYIANCILLVISVFLLAISALIGINQYYYCLIIASGLSVLTSFIGYWKAFIYTNIGRFLYVFIIFCQLLGCLASTVIEFITYSNYLDCRKGSNCLIFRQHSQVYLLAIGLTLLSFIVGGTVGYQFLNLLSLEDLFDNQRMSVNISPSNNSTTDRRNNDYQYSQLHGRQENHMESFEIEGN